MAPLQGELNSIKQDVVADKINERGYLRNRMTYLKVSKGGAGN